MDDLISRAAAIDAIVSVTAFPDAEYIKNLCQNPANSEDWLGGVCDAIYAVEEVNAVNAAPVVHARWTYFNCVGSGRYQCSECLHWVDAGTDRNYCPNCGARMDGEAHD